jgi:ATPase subunit of ABC transporter with duplicated ATPase domains
MDIINDPKFTLRNLDKINVLLGKNGCGKSSVLREVEEFVSHSGDWAATRYITPERGGALIYEPGIEHASTQNPQWMRTERRANQFVQFKQQTKVQYRRLELEVLRELERNRHDDAVPDFDQVLEAINSLLDNIEIRREGNSFAVYADNGPEVITANAISSGESELISLAIECLVFAREADSQTENLLCLDEPVVLGVGERLFGETSEKKSMRLVDAKTVGEGVVIHTYEPVRDPRE